MLYARSQSLEPGNSIWHPKLSWRDDETCKLINDSANQIYHPFDCVTEPIRLGGAFFLPVSFAQHPSEFETDRINWIRLEFEFDSTRLDSICSLGHWRVCSVGQFKVLLNHAPSSLCLRPADNLKLVTSAGSESKLFEFRSIGRIRRARIRSHSKPTELNQTKPNQTEPN